MKTSSSLCDLANHFGSDKGTLVGQAHRYTFLYDLILHPFRTEPTKFLEIGLAIGGPEVGGAVDRAATSPSVQMWLDYFPHGDIYGFDISDFSHQVCDRFTFIRGDSGNAADLKQLAQAAPYFDIIIDDASHASYHQQLAFRTLFGTLRSGGLYIFEDLHWQSPYFETALPAVPRTKDFMNEFFLQGRYVENVVLSREWMAALRTETAHYAAFPSFNDRDPGTKLIVIRKR